MIVGRQAEQAEQDVLKRDLHALVSEGARRNAVGRSERGPLWQRRGRNATSVIVRIPHHQAQPFQG